MRGRRIYRQAVRRSTAPWSMRSWTLFRHSWIRLLARLMTQSSLLLVGAMLLGCSSLGQAQSPWTTSPYDAQSSGSGETLPSEIQPAAYDEGQPGAESFTIKDLQPKNLGKTAKKLVGQGPNRTISLNLYQKARSQFLQANEARTQRQPYKATYLDAAETFATAAQRWPDSAVEEDAFFMEAQCYFFSDHYPKAVKRYARLIEKYPNTKHLDVVSAHRFAIAKYWLELQRVKPDSSMSVNLVDASRPRRGTFGQAVSLLDRIRLDDPTGKLADDATMAAGIAYFEMNRYIDAAEFFEDLRRTFPSSEHQFTAHLLQLKSRLESYNGPQYDSDPLVAADKLLTQIRRQFPREAQEHEEYLRNAYHEIRYQHAAIEMYTAKYYDRRGQYGAARFHYNILSNTFADTPFGPRATERMAQIRDKPVDPPQRLSWLVNLFPEPAEAKPLIPVGSGGSILR